jgi:hypothetical protein
MRVFPAQYLPNPTDRALYVKRGQGFNTVITAVVRHRNAAAVDMVPDTRSLFSSSTMDPPYGDFNARGCAAVVTHELDSPLR